MFKIHIHIKIPLIYKVLKYTLQSKERIFFFWSFQTVTECNGIFHFQFLENNNCYINIRNYEIRILNFNNEKTYMIGYDVGISMSNNHYSYSISIQKNSCYYKYAHHSSSLGDLDFLFHIQRITGTLCSLSK